MDGRCGQAAVLGWQHRATCLVRPDVIDYFFIIDGDLNIYLIPSRLIAGRVQILLRAYKEYIVGNASGLPGVAAGTAKGDARTSA
jgi:hypothetical protein